MTVTNIFTTKAKFGEMGTRFGLARLLSDIDMESLGDVSKVKYKPKKRIDLKKLEPKSSEENLEPESVEISTSSDDDKDSSKRRKAGRRGTGPASSKQMRSRRSQVSVAASSLEVEGGKRGRHQARAGL